MNDVPTADGLELLRVIINVIGFAIDVKLLLDSKRRNISLYDQGLAHIGRGHIMGPSNIWLALTLAACHLVLLFVAWEAYATPGGAVTKLGIDSNVGHALVAGALAAISAMTMQAQNHADLLDRHNKLEEKERNDLHEDIEGLRAEFRAYISDRSGGNYGSSMADA